MASIIKKLNKQTGITYVYESESYWDKDKKQPRSKRKLIGKLDEETGEIVPTGTRGKPGKRETSCTPENIPDARELEALCIKKAGHGAYLIRHFIKNSMRQRKRSGQRASGKAER